MKIRARRSRFDGMDREWLSTLFLCYIKWCIGEMPDEDRIELEKLTPMLQHQFRSTADHWYEVLEDAFGLAATGRGILAGSWRDMRGEISADEFVVEFANGFLKKAARRHRSGPAWAMNGRRRGNA